MKPCDGNHPGRDPRAGPYTPDQCRVCWLYLNDPAFRALWDVPGPDAGRTRPCLHRGEPRREELCPSCRGHVRLKVFACALHGECTIGRAVAGAASCATCPDYDPGAPPAPDVSPQPEGKGPPRLPPGGEGRPGENAPA